MIDTPHTATALCRNPACRTALFEFSMPAAPRRRGWAWMVGVAVTVCPACGSAHRIARLAEHAQRMHAELVARVRA